MMNIGVILCGCGFQDGSEIHEAVLTLLFLDQAGATPVCFAPDIDQAAVVDHRSGARMSDKRSVLAEAARIARGDIRLLSSANPDELDGAILPGGYGVAMNLSSFADKGAQCNIDCDLERLLRALHAQGKPIGAICIAPVILARLFGDEKPLLTIGSDQSVAKALQTMGAVHKVAEVDEVVVDERLRFVTTPAYMLAKSIAKAAAGIEQLVGAVVKLAKTGAEAAVNPALPRR